MKRSEAVKAILPILVFILGACAFGVAWLQPDPVVRWVVCGALGVRAFFWFAKGMGWL